MATSVSFSSHPTNLPPQSGHTWDLALNCPRWSYAGLFEGLEIRHLTRHRAGTSRLTMVRNGRKVHDGGRITATRKGMQTRAAEGGDVETAERALGHPLRVES